MIVEGEDAIVVCRCMISIPEHRVYVGRLLTKVKVQFLDSAVAAVIGACR